MAQREGASMGTVSMKQPYKIYSDPIPAPKPRRHSRIPFARMEVGRVVYVRTDRNSLDSLATSARKWAAQNNKDRRFLISLTGTVAGIWRLK